MPRPHLEAAEAEPQRIRQTELVPQRLQTAQHLFHQRLGLVASGLVEDHDELVAAEPEAEIRAAERPPHLLRDETQGPVALLVPVGVVDGLELVDVEQPHDQRAVAFSEPLQRPDEGHLPGPPVEQAGQVVAVGLLVQTDGIRNVHGLLEMHEGAVGPAHQAVVVFKNPSGQRVPLFPAVHAVQVHVRRQVPDGAEGTAFRHAGLQHLPTDAPLGMLQLERVLHGLIHVQDDVGVGIGDVQEHADLIHRGIEHADVEILEFAISLSGEEHPEHGVGNPRQPLFRRSPASRPRTLVEKQQAERRAVVTDRQFEGAVRTSRREQTGDLPFRQRGLLRKNPFEGRTRGTLRPFAPAGGFGHSAPTVQTDDAQRVDRQRLVERVREKRHQFAKRLAMPEKAFRAFDKGKCGGVNVFHTFPLDPYAPRSCGGGAFPGKTFLTSCSFIHLRISRPKVQRDAPVRPPENGSRRRAVARKTRTVRPPPVRRDGHHPGASGTRTMRPPPMRHRLGPPRAAASKSPPRGRMAWRPRRPQNGAREASLRRRPHGIAPATDAKGPAQPMPRGAFPNRRKEY